MRKVLITVIGLAGYNVQNNDVVGKKTNYIFNNENRRYYNILPLLIDEYNDFEIIPIYTELSKKAAKKILERENKEEYFNKIFSQSLATFIENENQKNSYTELLKKIDNLLSEFNNEDEVIIDITHGLRHIPILIIINAIMHNIKNPNKIKKIIFAKEVKRNEEYEIIDLKEYLELANLSFIISNFKNNYTLTTHIKFSKKEYMELINSMESFSADVLSLSIEHLLNVSSRKLIESIEKITDKKDLLKQDLENIKFHIEKVYSKKEHRYLTYYEIAKDLFEKGYLVNVISLLFEAVGFYAGSCFAKYNKQLANYLESLEKEITSTKNSNKKIKNFYELSKSCRSYLLFKKEKNRDTILEKFKDIIYENLPKNINKFSLYVGELSNIRNNLLHANASGEISEIRRKIKNLLESYEKFCITEDILTNK